VTYKLTTTQKPGYLHAVVTGKNSAATVARYLDELLRECKHRGSCRLLIEERLDGPRLDTFGVFELVSNMSARAAGFFEAIADVDVNAETAGSMKFAETVAVNRGVRGRVFTSVRDAERWLADIARESS